MGNFPPPIRTYIENTIVSMRSPAYLLVDEEQRLADWGGQLDHYGLTDLIPGQWVSDYLACLEGLLPLEDGELNLGWVQTQPECYADVHLFRWDSGACVLLLDATTEATQYCSMQQKVNDVSLGKEAAVASLKHYCAMAENFQRGLCVHQDFTIQFANSAMAQIFGAGSPDVLIGQDLRHLIAPYEHDRLEAYIKAHAQGEGAETSTVWQGVRCDGESCWVELSTSSTPWKGAVSMLMSCFDVTERRQLEAQVQLEQKMTALGTLAGGIAHDFNNLLTAILGYTQLALYETPEGSHNWGNLHEILQASHRAKDLVQNLFSFSQERVSEYQPVQLYGSVVEALEACRALLSPSVAIVEHLASDAGEVFANPGEIRELVTQLVMNAAQALENSGRGIIDVRLEPVEVMDETVASHPELRLGPHVRLQIRDTGCGMEPETLARVFEPAFTTKYVDEAHGMGLTCVQRTIARHGGAIRMTSELGEGTTCTVYFPRIRMPVPMPTAPSIHTSKKVDRDPHLSEHLPGGQERILLIDDETVLVELGREILTQLGYDVVTHTNASMALENVRTSPDQFDLVITDRRMPQMSGESLIYELQGIRPDLPIIMLTGCRDTVTSGRAQELGIRAFLTKPLVLRDLAQAIRHVLD